MNQNIIFPILLITCSLFRQISSATVWEVVENQSEDNDYTISREASIHRGLFLSLSEVQKNEICRDLFYTQFYDEVPVQVTSLSVVAEESTSESRTSDPENVDEPSNPVLVGNVIFPGQPEALKTDLMIQCDAKYFPHEKRPHDTSPEITNKVSIISAFRPAWMYLLNPWTDSMQPDMLLQYYVGLSPEYVEMDQTKLEDHYVNIRRKIEVLEKESPEYVELINDNDNISNLSRWEKLHLCASILSSRAYQKEGKRFSYHWVHTTEDTPTYNIRFLSFENPQYDAKLWSTNCLYCEGWVAWDDWTELQHIYLARTYDDENSVLALRLDHGRILPDKYFKNVHIFENELHRVPRDKLTQKFSL